MTSRLTGALGPVGPLPEQLEQWRQRLLRQLPGPLHGVRTLFVGDPLKVIVSFEDDRVEVFLPQVEWAIRITSYNVCYTKLLRGLVNFRTTASPFAGKGGKIADL